MVLVLGLVVSEGAGLETGLGVVGADELVEDRLGE